MFGMMIDIGPKFYRVPSPPPMHDLKVKVTELLCQSFRTSLFPNPMMDLVHVWYDDGYWSKILHSTIPTPIHDIKVTDLELLC